MDQAEALLNLQSRRSTRQSKPTKHPDFLYTDADFLDERDLFSQHQSSFTDPSKQEASGSQLFSSVMQPATKQSNKQSKRPKKSQKPDSGLPYEADLKRQLYDLQLRDEQADLLTVLLSMKGFLCLQTTQIHRVHCSQLLQSEISVRRFSWRSCRRRNSPWN